MMLYLAAGKPLPLIAWNEENPNFNVTELEKYSEDVRRQFSKSHVYDLGSHQSCACGFSYSQYDEDKEEHRAARESVQQLSDYLSRAVSLTGEIELYACWTGDEAELPEFRVVLPALEITQEFEREHFNFCERTFVTITP